MAERAGRRLTFGRLRADIVANADCLRSRNVRRAALYTQDSYWFLVGLLALLQAGAEILLPPNGQPGTLASAIGDADLLVSDSDTTGGLVLVEGESEPPIRALKSLDPTSCNLDFFTSGSTGERKLIGKTLDQLEREVAVLEALWGEQLGACKVLGMVSHQHIFGLTFRLLWPVMAGRPFDALSHLAWETVIPELVGPTALVVSPAHLTRLGGVTPLAPAQRPRAVLTAGAPVPFRAAQEAEAILGQLPTEIFGSTETGAIAWRRQDREGAPWKPLPGVTVEIGPEGVLGIHSPFLPPGARYDSPDLVERDGEGFHFRGRSDRIVKIEGKRASISEIERELRAAPEVEDCAIAMLSESREFLGAVVTLSALGREALSGEGKLAVERRLRKSLSSTQEAVSLPRRWRFVDTLPTDGMGKLDRSALARLLAPRAPDAPEIRASRTTDRGVEVDLRLPPGLTFFDGHFDGFPILPGVVQLKWAVDFARRYLPIVGYPGQLSQLKFRRPVRPEDLLTLKLERRTTGGRDSVAFEYIRDGDTCSSGKIAFTQS